MMMTLMRIFHLTMKAILNFKTLFNGHPCKASIRYQNKEGKNNKPPYQLHKKPKAMQTTINYIQLICIFLAFFALIAASVWGLVTFRKNRIKKEKALSKEIDDMLKCEDIDFNNCKP